jgi:hypothetical protein
MRALVLGIVKSDEVADEEVADGDCKRSEDALTKAN